MSDELRLATAVLLHVSEPAMVGLCSVVAEHGAIETVAMLQAGRALPDVDAEGIRQRLSPDCGQRDLDLAAACGGRLIIPTDEEWPAAMADLDRLGAGAFGLYVRGAGDLASLCAQAVAVVGTRAMTDYGCYVAEEFGVGLVQRGWTVVSGLAFGIDAAAHRGAIAGGGPTVAVLASGIDVTYPRSHESLLRQVLQCGLVVSESPPGSAPHRGRFLTRNRLIAALSAGTLVVEAAARSGARNTARHAGVLGRAVMAVPGPLTSPASVGCHQLLRDDPAVSLVTGTADIIEAVGPMGELAPRATGATASRDALSRWHRALLDSVPVSRGASVASIARAGGFAPDRVERGLCELSSEGFVEETERGWRLSESARQERRGRGGSSEGTLDLDWW